MAFNASADSSRTSIKLIRETAVGVTPATPTGYEVEITGESLTNSREMISSQSFRSDRQVPGASTVGETSSGDLNYELKYTDIMWEMIAAALQCDEDFLTDDKITNGVTRRSYTVQKHFTDASGSGAVQFYRGSELTTMSLELATGSFVTGSFGVMARSSDQSATPVVTTTVPAGVAPFMTTVAPGSELLVNGVAYTDGIQSFSMTLDNNAREQRQIGSADLAGVGMGRSNITGTLTAYFNGSNPLQTAYLADQYVSIGFVIPDADGNKYVITLDAAKLGNAQVNAGGLDQDVVMQFEFQATMSATTGKTISFERIPA